MGFKEFKTKLKPLLAFFEFWLFATAVNFGKKFPGKFFSRDFSREMTLEKKSLRNGFLKRKNLGNLILEKKSLRREIFISRKNI
jgi:hypothetical protein